MEALKDKRIIGQDGWASFKLAFDEVLVTWASAWQQIHGSFTRCSPTILILRYCYASNSLLAAWRILRHERDVDGGAHSDSGST